MALAVTIHQSRDIFSKYDGSAYKVARLQRNSTDGWSVQRRLDETSVLPLPPPLPRGLDMADSRSGPSTSSSPQPPPPSFHPQPRFDPVARRGDAMTTAATQLAPARLPGIAQIDREIGTPWSSPAGGATRGRSLAYDATTMGRAHPTDAFAGRSLAGPSSPRHARTAMKRPWSPDYRAAAGGPEDRPATVSSRPIADAAEPSHFVSEWRVMSARGLQSGSGDEEHRVYAPMRRASLSVGSRREVESTPLYADRLFPIEAGRPSTHDSAQAPPFYFDGRPSLPAKRGLGEVFPNSAVVDRPTSSPQRTALPPSALAPASLRRDSMPSLYVDHHGGAHYAASSASSSPPQMRTASNSLHHDLAPATWSSSSAPLGPPHSSGPVSVGAPGNAAETYASASSGMSHFASRRRGKLPRQVTDLLKSWLLDHASHPYPSEEEKRMLCERTGLSISQVSNWFINARRRILIPQSSGGFALNPNAELRDFYGGTGVAHPQAPPPPPTPSTSQQHAPQHHYQHAEPHPHYRAQPPYPSKGHAAPPPFDATRLRY